MTRGSLLAWTGLGLLLAGAATIRLSSTIPQATIGIDDANIFLTFGRNLATGHGFVYSLGGERVEGFTSLLWAVVAAAAWAVAPGRPEPLLRAANVALLAATAGLLGASLNRIARDLASLPASGVARLFPALSLLWLFASPAYVLWTTVPLMEAALWGFVITAVTLAAVWTARPGFSRGTVAAFCGLLVLTPLTRPEGLLLGPLALSLSAGLLLARDSWKEVLRRCAVPAAFLVGSMVLLTGFRLAYFGYPVPNTFYAKVSPSLAHNLGEGLAYLAGFLRATPVGMVSLGSALVVIGAAVNRRWRRRPDSNDPSRPFEDELAGVSVVVLVLVLLPVLTGGDHFPDHRFYQPVWPLLALPPLGLAATLWRGSPDSRSLPVERKTGTALASLLGLITLALLLAPRVGSPTTSSDPSAVSSLDLGFAIAAEGRGIGQVLNAQFPGPDKPVVGATAVGGLGYAYEGPVFDMLGLANVKMAHSPGLRLGIKDHAAFDEDVFYEAAPALVEPTLRRAYRPGKPGKLDPWTNRVLNGLLESRRFRDAYVAVVLGLPRDETAPPPTRGVVQAWVRRDLVRVWRGRGMRLDEVPMPARAASREGPST